MIRTVPQTKSLRPPASSLSWCRTCSCSPPPPSSYSSSPPPETRAGWFLPSRTWSWENLYFNNSFENQYRPYSHDNKAILVPKPQERRLYILIEITFSYCSMSSTEMYYPDFSTLSVLSHLPRFIMAVPRSFRVSAFQRGYPGSTLQRTSMDSSHSSLILMKSSLLRVGRLLWE